MKERVDLSLMTGELDGSTLSNTCFEGNSNKLAVKSSASSKDLGGAGPSGACPILDTSLLKRGKCDKTVGRLFNRRNRKMWARSIWGMKLPGRYYFLTLTTIPTTPPLPLVWDLLRKWLKNHRRGICWLYCFTLEGQGPGVIHMVVRLGHRQKNIDVKELREWWKEHTGAVQIKIKRVPEDKKDDLCSYLANQKIKTGMACEMGYQSAVTRWRWSKGWLPKGFTLAHKREWKEWLEASEFDRLKAVSVLLQVMYEKEVKS